MNFTTNGFKKLLDLKSTGLQSVTAINVGKCDMVTNGGSTYCPGKYTTVWMDTGGGDSTPGYQLDYIWYRGLKLAGDFTVSAMSKSCSDHLLVQATFVLPWSQSVTQKCVPKVCHQSRDAKVCASLEKRCNIVILFILSLVGNVTITELRSPEKMQSRRLCVESV